MLKKWNKKKMLNVTLSLTFILGMVPQISFGAVAGRDCPDLAEFYNRQIKIGARSRSTLVDFNSPVAERLPNHVQDLILRISKTYTEDLVNNAFMGPGTLERPISWKSVHQNGCNSLSVIDRNGTLVREQIVRYDRDSITLKDFFGHLRTVRIVSDHELSTTDSRPRFFNLGDAICFDAIIPNEVTQNTTFAGGQDNPSIPEPSVRLALWRARVNGSWSAWQHDNRNSTQCRSNRIIPTGTGNSGGSGTGNLEDDSESGQRIQTSSLR